MSDISHEELLLLVSYDPLTGVFTRRDTGKITGCKDKNGYLQIRLKSKLYYAHRLAWFYVHREWAKFVDHREDPRCNNAIANLRAATKTQNNRNSRQKSTNKSGYKGVCFIRKSWVATITVDRERKVLGLFTDPREAALAYDSAATKHHGEFAKTNKTLGLL